jgi:hypothetical protein
MGNPVFYIPFEFIDDQMHSLAGGVAFTNDGERKDEVNS